MIIITREYDFVFQQHSASSLLQYLGHYLMLSWAQVIKIGHTAGSLKTKVYIVSLGGFDTHSAQIGDVPTIGTHANLLRQLSEAVSFFQQDLKLIGKDEKVLTMTFSEFGRQIRSNDSAVQIMVMLLH